jgi:hypothetical protein
MLVSFFKGVGFPVKLIGLEQGRYHSGYMPGCCELHNAVRDSIVWQPER